MFLRVNLYRRTHRRISEINGAQEAGYGGNRGIRTNRPILPYVPEEISDKRRLVVIDFSKKTWVGSSRFTSDFTWRGHCQPP